ncbi:hypothetical protein [Streptomyces resistomycificus]|nr:hypothetical protein [Streptomyces resistomycificus]
MAVTDGLWWSVWWPWMTVWLVTAAGLVALAAVLLGHAREARRRTAARQTAYSICFYLDGKSVMDLYQVSHYSEALEQAVEHRTNVNTSVSLLGKLMPWTVKAGKDVTQEKFTKYVQKNEPINVIGMLTEALDRADAIVHADLRTGSVRPNRALADALAGDTRIALSDIDEFVSVRGRFVMDPDTSQGIVLRAAYGDPQTPPYVRVVGAREGLRRETIPEGTFTARCLGKMTGWRQDTGEVTLEAIAIFR